MRNIIHKLSKERGITIIVSSHILEELVKVADSNYTYFARSISEDETKKLARTTEALMSGKNFNILASDSNFSDHSTSQITTGGDLGIMDVTTGFNNEYKLGIYTYFAYGSSDAATNEQAKFLLTGNDATLVSRYDELYKDGFNVITTEQVAEQIGATRIITTDLLGDDFKAVAMIPSEYYMVGRNILNPEFYSWHEGYKNLDVYRYECVAGGGINGLKSTAVLKAE